MPRSRAIASTPIMRIPRDSDERCAHGRECGAQGKPFGARGNRGLGYLHRVSDDYRFHHFAIVAKDFDQIVRWYQRHFGFTVAKQWTVPEMLPGARMCYLKKGALFLEVIGDGEKAGQHIVAEGPLQDYQITGIRHFAFEVDDVDAAIARLSDAGVPVFFAPMDFPVIGLRAALVRDPEGNTVELIQPLR
jgi:catechol 2,3-dioxygenase-like lactoylglutathione lyase family enzyme